MERKDRTLKVVLNEKLKERSNTLKEKEKTKVSEDITNPVNDKIGARAA